MGGDRPQPAGNALKFTFEGSISVSLRHQGTHAVLRVADTGIGVPAAELSRIFERFHRVPDARSRSGAGSGIGLALVREMAALHRGTITADSTEGTGTRLTIRLPLGHDHLPRSDQQAAPEHGPADPQAAPADSARLLLPGRRAAVRGTAARVQQRETAIALQRAILGPAQLPADFAARYEPATQPLEVGGDWYDIMRLPAGRIGIVVGDCVGHDLGAATIMGQLRSACRAVLLQNASPAQALAVLDQFAARIPGAMCSTAFCVILDPATGRFTYSSAGHPPGILAHPDGRAELLEGGRSLSLAIEPGRRRPDAEGWLPAGAVLLLYTDGLVERRRRPLTAGIAAVAAALQDGHRLPVQDLASRVMAALAPSGGYEDDVALVLYRHPGTDAPRPGASVR